jgi:hypothetical protein
VDRKMACELRRRAQQVRGQAGFQGETYPLQFLLADIEIECGPEGNENHMSMFYDRPSLRQCHLLS